MIKDLKRAGVFDKPERQRPQVRRVGPRTWEAESATRPELGVNHRVDWTLDDAFMCNCEAGMNNTECWAVKAARKETESMTTATESRALVPVKVTPPTALVLSDREMNQIQRQAAAIFAGAVALPQELNTPEKVAAVMMYGWELGLRPMTALKHLYIVKGRVSPSAEVMAGLLIARYPDARLLIDQLDDDHVVMRLRWPGRKVDETYQVKWADIVKAGLASGNNLQYPHDRMIKHATKRLLRIYAPDVINGLDAGAPRFDGADVSLEPEDDDFDEGDLYNEGDEPEQDYIEGQVLNTSTGEIKDAPSAGAGYGQPAAASEGAAQPTEADAGSSPAAAAPDAPKATREQIALIREWNEQVKEKRGADAVNACSAWAKATFGYAMSGGRFTVQNLMDIDANALIDVLKSCAETGSLPAVQETFA